MEKTIRKLLNLGMDLSTRNAVKSALSFLEINEELADEAYVNIKNDFNRKAFASAPFNKRILFLPQCLRNSKKCTAELTDKGYICRECGECSIKNIKREAEKLGYKVYVVPGGSMVFKIMIKEKPKAVAGVACYFELSEAIEKCSRAGVPSQGVPLKKSGCKDTRVSEKEVIEMLRQKSDSSGREQQS